MPTKPAWLDSHLAEKNRVDAASSALGAAADQTNVCRVIAATLHTQGREHHTDLTWRTAVTESHRLQAVAAAHGFDEHAIGEEAARRRTSAEPASHASAPRQPSTPEPQKKSRVRINLTGRKNK